MIVLWTVVRGRAGSIPALPQADKTTTNGRRVAGEAQATGGAVAPFRQIHAKYRAARALKGAT